MVTNVVQLTENKKQIQHIKRIYHLQKEAFSRNPMPSYDERIDNLKRLKSALMNHQDNFINAIAHDFGGRSEEETKLAEIMTCVQNINYTIKHLKQWMKPVKKDVGLLFQPAANQVQYQPLGVIGIIAPWNYPVSLSVGPLIAALAAGNRAMIKMSEFTPMTSDLVHDILKSTFPENLVSVINGDADVATEFSKVAWDHLIFTGSTAVGKYVMRAAAENLTPVTLELGGKSPTIISHDIPMDEAAQRIVFGKAFNAGQTCIAPDYILCPEDRVDQFVELFQQYFAKMYPTIKNNPDFTSIINERQYQRLQSYLEDARNKGATLVPCNPKNEDLSEGTRKMPIHLVLNPNDKMKVMQEEIFGPILPIISYKTLDEAIVYVNQRPTPLAMYYFSYDKNSQQHVLDRIRSGGACINDTLSHFAQEDMPFGGIGPSGMGRYHGEAGFRTFSNPRGIFSKQRLNSTKFAYPPYGKIHQMIFSLFIR
jgi:coniferyl-aldehyde dehydrogenase